MDESSGEVLPARRRGKAEREHDAFRVIVALGSRPARDAYPHHAHEFRRLDCCGCGCRCCARVAHVPCEIFRDWSQLLICAVLDSQN
jgi:hypothetical protein